MTDRQVRDEIVAELEFEPAINPVRIGVSVEHGVVTLSGHVESYSQKLTAERVAKRVYSAKAVVNDLHVALPARDEVPDAELAERLVRMIDVHAVLPKDSIRVTVREGHVILEGVVDTWLQCETAANLVQHLRGVREVRNQIQVKPQTTAADLHQKIAEALRRHAAIDADNVHVELRESTVVLTGTVHSWHEREEAVAAAWRAPGVIRVEDLLTIAS